MLGSAGEGAAADNAIRRPSHTMTTITSLQTALTIRSSGGSPLLAPCLQREMAAFNSPNGNNISAHHAAEPQYHSAQLLDSPLDCSGVG